MPGEVRDNPSRKRFELDVDGEIAFVTYRNTNSAIILDHAEVPWALEGRGIGSALAKGVLESLRRDKRKVVVICPFIAAYIRKHRGYESLLAVPLRDPQRDSLDARLDEALAETFPASDPTAVTPER